MSWYGQYCPHLWLAGQGQQQQQQQQLEVEMMMAACGQQQQQQQQPELQVGSRSQLVAVSLCREPEC